MFATTDQGIDWSIVTAAMTDDQPLKLVAFLLFQRQFVQSFMRAGIVVKKPTVRFFANSPYRTLALLALLALLL